MTWQTEITTTIWTIPAQETLRTMVLRITVLGTTALRTTVLRITVLRTMVLRTTALRTIVLRTAETTARTAVRTITRITTDKRKDEGRSVFIRSGFFISQESASYEIKSASPGCTCRAKGNSSEATAQQRGSCAGRTLYSFIEKSDGTCFAYTTVCTD